jgi:hypothetical protein
LSLINDDNSTVLTDEPLVLCKEPEQAPPVWTDFIMIICLATMSGAFSGLNLGLLSLDVKDLELLTKGPFKDE